MRAITFAWSVSEMADYTSIDSAVRFGGLSVREVLRSGSLLNQEFLNFMDPGWGEPRSDFAAQKRPEKPDRAGQRGGAARSASRQSTVMRSALISPVASKVIFPFRSYVIAIIQWPAAAFFLIVSYSLICLAGPHWKERHWHWITPGSAFGAIIWLTASAVFKIYLGFSNHYSIYYGSLGAVMILLLWLYAAGLAFLIGGEINAQIDRARLVYKS